MNSSLNRVSLRRALKLLSPMNAEALAKHVWSSLEVVEAFRAKLQFADSPTGRGKALGQLLREALNHLRPSKSQPDWANAQWRAYLILNEQYVSHRPREYVADALFIDLDTYNHSQATALDMVLGWLSIQQEQAAQTVQTTSNASSGTAYINNVPVRGMRTFFGRANLVDDVSTLLLAHESVALFGLPGVGKTTLSLELAQHPQVRAHFMDGMLWAGLGTKPDLISLLGIWLIALGVSPDLLSRYKTLNERSAFVRSVIGTRCMLILIDDAWQVDAAQALKLGGPNCAYLVTTRSLQVAQQISPNQFFRVGELAQADGVQLLTSFLAQDTVAAKSLSTLTQAVNGLPLALTLMGNYLRTQHSIGGAKRTQLALRKLGEANKRLQLQHPTLVRYHSSDTESAPRTLQNIIGLSEEVMSEPARQVLPLLATFLPKPHTFSEEAILAAAQQVSQPTQTIDPEDILDELINAGLLEPTGTGRYVVHQVIADYAALKFADPALIRAVIEHYVVWLETHEAQKSIWDKELPNLLKALSLADEHGFHGLFLRGVAAISGYFHDRCLFAQAEPMLKRALEVAQQQSNREHVVRSHLSLGKLKFAYGHFEEAMSLFEAAYRDCDEMIAVDIVNNCHYCMGVVAHALGQIKTAEQHFRRGLANSAGSTSEHRLLEQLGEVLLKQGQVAQAHDLLERSFALSRARQDHSMAARTLHMLGDIAISNGQLDEAVRCQLQAIELYRQCGDLLSESFELAHLGLYERKRRNYAQAQSNFEQSLEIARKLNSRRFTLYPLRNFGELHDELGNDGVALDMLLEAEKLAQVPEDICTVLWRLGNFYRRRKLFEESLRYYKRVELLGTEHGLRRIEALAFKSLALLLAEMNQTDKAHDNARKAHQLYTSMGMLSNEHAVELHSRFPAGLFD